MNISFDHAGPVMVAKISGELSVKDLTEFLDHFKDLKDQGISSVLLDIGEIEFMGSTALSVIIALHRSLGESRIKVALCSPSRAVSQVLVTTRLDKVLEVFTDRRAALAGLGHEYPGD